MKFHFDFTYDTDKKKTHIQITPAPIPIKVAVNAFANIAAFCIAKIAKIAERTPSKVAEQIVAIAKIMVRKEK